MAVIVQINPSAALVAAAATVGSAVTAAAAAAISQTAAAGSATAAASSATTASGAATSATASNVSVTAALLAFRSAFLGAFTSDAAAAAFAAANSIALVTGIQYENTTTPIIRVYISGAWQDQDANAEAAQASATLSATNAATSASNASSSATAAAASAVTAASFSAATEFSRTPITAAYTVLATDRTIPVTALSAAINLTLCSAASFPTGRILKVLDKSGSATATNTITLTGAGSDLINGKTTAIIKCAYGYVQITSNGSNRWTIVGIDLGSTVAALPTVSGVPDVMWNNGGIVQQS